MGRHTDYASSFYQEDLVKPLSPTEARVLWMRVRGMSFKETACALGVSLSTVKNHTTSALRKLGFSSLSEVQGFYISAYRMLWRMTRAARPDTPPSEPERLSRGRIRQTDSRAVLVPGKSNAD